jgi:hypothetical protein
MDGESHAPHEVAAGRAKTSTAPQHRSHGPGVDSARAAPRIVRWARRALGSAGAPADEPQGVAPAPQRSMVLGVRGSLPTWEHGLVHVRVVSGLTSRGRAARLHSIRTSRSRTRSDVCEDVKQPRSGGRRRRARDLPSWSDAYIASDTTRAAFVYVEIQGCVMTNLLRCVRASPGAEEKDHSSHRVLIATLKATYSATRGPGRQCCNRPIRFLSGET